ncbi:MAG: Rne/Rng family ribonuclease [Blastochloris viridis]|uniref:Rne/Rng family ribonuclease n=1 Tax=Blastochloris viridis TaxID=1079 RepID=A0A6N4R298_BLAVI|nr:MAG: Rne/Rng family ribonuclease [Blastochloris viridis]
MKRMLIDAAHTEETRVVILDGNKIDDFEIETQGKAQLKGNIYIGHVSRVEPSLQAAFITYGGNRNGFLAFGEVHPQFFAVSKTEKAELLKEVAEAAARRRGADFDDEPEQAEDFADKLAHEDSAPSSKQIAKADKADKAEKGNEATEQTSEELSDEEAAAKAAAMADAGETGKEPKEGRGRRGRQPRRMESKGRPRRAEASTPVAVEEAASSEGETEAKGAKEKPKNQPPIHRRYRIQDVLKEGQKILVQVVKEERGSKGAALTTYFSLPGRYTVLMPNTPYAGGISRKITDPQERRQLREAYSELNVPATMGLIIRTAGVGQPMAHITNDYENLTNLWKHINEEFEANDDIQCVHEDGSVIIRALRDMTNEDIGEITISGARAYKMAKDFAKSFMPDTVGLIKQYKDETPLFSQAKVEQKLNMLHHTRVTLPSGGYLVINPTEALVSVDINSGRATQERNIEETAVKTNLEACEELARQIRLRDLAGLIVVDFIDMEDNRNNRKVENAMRKALRRDRARIQTGNISDFGLMEISRQRLRPSFGESHFIACPHCLGSGQVHSPATAALMVLRKLEEDDVRDADRITVTSSTPLVLWLLNHKRDVIRSLEERYKYQLQFRADDRLTAPDHTIELISFKSDGTEHSRLIEVTLREQPELPPELRQRHQGPRRDEQRREERRDEPRRSNGNEQRAEKSEKSDKPERNDRNERNDKSRKPERNDRNDKQAKSDKPERTEGKSEQSGGARRPRRLGETSGAEEAVTETTENTSDKRTSKPQREAKSDTRADSKPERKPEPKAEKKTEQKQDKPKPIREQKPAEDQPLAVQKVSVDNDDAPVIKAAPRKKFEIRKQADTDAADAPIAIAKLSEESQPEAAPTRGKKEAKEKTGIISRLIGR